MLIPNWFSAPPARTLKYLGICLIALLLTPLSAHAVLVNYTFSGVVGGTGSFLDLGNGQTAIAQGTGFTATGMTLNDTDITGAAAQGTGAYAAMTTYTVDGVGSFTTDNTSDENYVQGFGGPNSFSVIGLMNSGFFEGFFFRAGIFPVTPKLGAVPIGTPAPPFFNAISGRTWTNGSGHTLSLNLTSGIDIILSATVVAKVAEPGALVLFAAGLAGISVIRRRRVT